MSVPILTLNLLNKHRDESIDEWSEFIFKIEDNVDKALKQGRLGPQCVALEDGDYLVHHWIKVVPEQFVPSVLDDL